MTNQQTPTGPGSFSQVSGIFNPRDAVRMETTMTDATAPKILTAEERKQMLADQAAEIARVEAANKAKAKEEADRLAAEIAVDMKARAELEAAAIKAAEDAARVEEPKEKTPYQLQKEARKAAEQGLKDEHGNALASASAGFTPNPPVEAVETAEEEFSARTKGEMNAGKAKLKEHAAREKAAAEAEATSN